MIANYHTHTSRCMHASGTDREYVENAITNGLKILGFADHAPSFGDINSPLVTGVRMPLCELEGYLYSLEGLKKEYKSDIEIHIGLEMECVPSLFEKEMQLLKGYPIEYMLFSNHHIYFDHESPIYHYTHPTGDESIIKKYVDDAILAIDRGCFTYVCHPDMINFIGDNEVYQSHMQRLISKAVSSDIPLEFNMLGMRFGRHYPTPLFWQLVAKQDVKPRIILGCDAHSPDRCGNKNEEKDAICYLSNLGLTPIKTVELKKPI